MVVCLMQCYIYGVYIGRKDVTEAVHQRLSAFSDESDVDDPTDEELLKVLLLHGARVDLIYPGGFDVLEAAASAGSEALLPTLLTQEPYASMAAGKWSSSSSSSSGPEQPAAQSSSCHQASRPGTSAATCAVKFLDRHSQPLTWTTKLANECIDLCILDCGWDPRKQPDDAGSALLLACGEEDSEVRLAAAMTGPA
jgi:hypothetical protein